MILGRLIDRIIAEFFPRWGRQRVCERAAYKAVANFDGAKKDRTNIQWVSKSGTADALLFGDLTLLINRSRDLCRNTSLGRAVVTSYLRNVIGTGIRPNATATDASGEPMVEFNDALNAAFFRWADDPRQCDVEKRLTFWEMQEQVLQRVVEDGGILVHRRILESGDRRIPFVLQRFEIDQLAIELTQDRNTKNEIRRGVEVDGMGAAVAYHLYDKPLNDIAGGTPQRIVRIPADRIDHLYRCERPGQTHGIPLIAPVMNRIQQLAEFDNYEVLAAKVSACIALIVNRGSHEAGQYGGSGLAGDATEDGVDSRGNQETFMEPGMVYKGELGDEIKGFMPTRPGNTYAPFTKEQKAMIAAGANLGFEQVARDFSGGTFASQRQSKLEDQRVFEPWQRMLINHLNKPVWNEFVTYAVLSGVVESPDFFTGDTVAMQSAEWQPHGWDWIDPEKEANAQLLRLQMRTESRTRAAARQGIVFADEAKQIAKDELLLESLSVDPALPGANSNQDNSQNNNGNGSAGNGKHRDRFAGILG